jgi:hypothetical protein
MDEQQKGDGDLDFELEPESLVCSHCYNPYAFNGFTPYLLPCAHTGKDFIFMMV